MTISVTLTDHSAQVNAKFREATRFGVDAAANVLEREVKKAHNAYYTTQAFRSTAQIRQSIRRSSPEATPTGWQSSVGSSKKIALYWELGHQNLFTRKYERVRLWVPTAIDVADKVRAAYARVVARMMGNG